MLGFCRTKEMMLLLTCALACCQVAYADDGGEVEGKPPEKASEHGVTVGVSYDTSRGNYGGATEIINWNRTLSAEIDVGNFNISASAPYIRQYGPIGTIVIAGHPVIVHGKPLVKNGKVVRTGGGTAVKLGTVDGWGDVNTAVTYFFDSNDDNAPLYDVKVNAKLNSGNPEMGLGSGTTDYTLQADVSQSYGDWILSGSVAYTFVGHVADVSLRNYGFVSFDVSKKLTEHGKLGMLFNSSQSAVDGSPAARDITLYYLYEFSKNQKMQAYYLKGLQKGSPDQGAGVNLNVLF